MPTYCFQKIHSCSKNNFNVDMLFPGLVNSNYSGQLISDKKIVITFVLLDSSSTELETKRPEIQSENESTFFTQKYA